MPADLTPAIEWGSPVPDLDDMLTIEDPDERFRQTFELAKLYRTMLRAAVALNVKRDRENDDRRRREPDGPDIRTNAAYRGEVLAFMKRMKWLPPGLQS